MASGPRARGPCPADVEKRGWSGRSEAWEGSGGQTRGDQHQNFALRSRPRSAFQSQGLARLSGWREVASPALPCSRAAQERGPPSASSERLLSPGRLAPRPRFNDVPRWLLCSSTGNGGLQRPSRPGLTGFISLEISIDEQDRGKRRSFWMFCGIL